ncbi:tetratricopeptide repeat protein [Brachyspira aalborgi]|uniref:tetratricopeptide repeat protein n=1 Tax=Brachyspira aalborgi TaxID=29522 RepID=UPI0011C8F54A|nr:tetratricopeptide repeat protein [Brachyspira aalborgi]TXJ51642.1 tetratricopeptide repeat protein [Brachyspira aalborgi]
MTREAEIKILKLIEEKNYSEVLKICDEILARNEDAVAYFYKAISKFDLGEYKEAIKYQNKAIELKNNNNNKYNTNDNYKSKIEEDNEYINYINKVIEANPNNAELYNIRGNYKAKSGKYEEAIKDYDKAIAIEPNNGDYYFNRGNAKGNLNLNNEAIKNYDISIKLSPNDIVAHYNRGTTKGFSGLYKKSIEDFDKVIELINNGIYLPIGIEPHINKLELDAYSNRGFSNFLLGNYTDAIKDFSKVIELNPSLARAYYNRGLNKDCLELYDDALIDFKQYIELIKNHKSIEIINIIGSFYYDIKISDIEYIFNQLIKKEDYNNLWERDIIFNLLKQKIKNKNILNDIKEILLYQYLLLHSLSFNNITPNDNQNIEISHYTSFEILKKLIEENNKIRITNISNANDPKEGKILEDIFNKNGLNLNIKNDENLITLQTSFSRNKDALTMFRLYGKNENKEATGICLVLDKEYFGDNPSQFSNLIQITRENEKTNKKINDIKIEQKRHLYWILYYNEKENQLVFNPNNSKYSNIIIDLNNLKKFEIEKESKLNNKENIIKYIFYNILNCIEKLNNQIENKNLKDEIFSNLFENIRYIIKHEAFFEEQELRMLITTNYKNENINIEEDKKRLYINYNELFNENENFIKEIILGGKIEDKELTSDYIKQIIYNKYKDNDKMNKIKVSISQAPLR